MNLPDWLREKLSSPPSAGAGIHAWLFSVARQLHAHMAPAEIAATLEAATANAGRRVTRREIRDAVNNSKAVAWTAKDKPQERVAQSFGKIEQLESAPESRSQWPKPDPVARRCRVADSAADGVAGLADLWHRSPIQPEFTADDWLDRLFPDAEWLCLAGEHPGSARSRRREAWMFGPAQECGLIVPSPMTGPSGRGLDGRQSHRCLGNTGARRWLVIEFDKLEDGKTNMPIDEQAALHWHLGDAAQAAGWPRLVLAVWSGGKSLHGWYGPITSEDAAHELMAYGVTLGADPATWNRSQLVRLPGGRRKAKSYPACFLPDGFEMSSGEFVTQEIFYFDSSFCEGNPIRNAT